MPHGLGHFLGIDTHDCGGYPTVCTAPTLSPSLRHFILNRVLKGSWNLESAAFVLLGCCKLACSSPSNLASTSSKPSYFPPSRYTHYNIPSHSLTPHTTQDEIKSKFLNEERIRQFLGFGGVRLEDDVVVTSTGAENYTICPRTVEEVEACMAGKPWQKQ